MLLEDRDDPVAPSELVAGTGSRTEAGSLMPTRALSALRTRSMRLDEEYVVLRLYARNRPIDHLHPGLTYATTCSRSTAFSGSAPPSLFIFLRDWPSQTVQGSVVTRLRWRDRT